MNFREANNQASAIFSWGKQALIRKVVGADGKSEHPSTEAIIAHCRYVFWFVLLD